MLRQALEAARAVSDSPHAAPLHAAFRQGVKELGDQLGKALPDTPTVEEPGQVARPTQALVTRQMTGQEQTSRQVEMDR